MRTLKFKAKPTNAFRYGQSNRRSAAPPRFCRTTAERAVMKSLSTVQTTKQCSSVVRILIDGSEKRICRLGLNFRIRMLVLKGAVTINQSTNQDHKLLSQPDRFEGGVV